MSAAPTVTVVMPVRNPDPRYFPAAVASVLNQTLVDFEFVIVEDADSRPSADHAEVRPVAEDLSRFDDPRIRHVTNVGTGIASARNRGLAEARADLVAMFDADDICRPERLERQCARLHEEPELTLLGTQLTILDEHDRERGMRRYPTEHEEILRRMPIYNPIAHPSVVVRKAAIAAVGGYRDRTCEDYDLWSRLALHEARFANLPEPYLAYRMHSGAMKSRMLRASLRDTIRIKREHWRDRQGVRGQIRMLAERSLLLLPPRLVMALFKRLQVDSGARA